MRTRLAILTTIFLFGFSGMTLFGQRTEEVKANVSFPFLVENTTLPAGEYVVSSLTPDSSVLTIRNQARNVSVDFLTEAVESKKQEPREGASLVFDVVSGRHFLSEIWTSDRSDGWKLIPSRTEKQEMKAAGSHMSRKTINCTDMKKS